jgi:hypothetical protein
MYNKRSPCCGRYIIYRKNKKGYKALYMHRDPKDPHSMKMKKLVFGMLMDALVLSVSTRGNMMMMMVAGSELHG